MDLSPYSQQSRWLSSTVPRQWVSKLGWLSDRSRRMPIFLRAGSGSGKSRLMGRILAWQDFLRGTPLVIIDPHGPTIDNFLDKIIRLPAELQKRIWSRVRYVDMSGRYGSVTPFPLYYRLGNESLYEIAQRPLDVIRKIDPHLQTASVEGWNALHRTGTYTGMVLAALTWQITEAKKILQNPEILEQYITPGQSFYPELRPAAAFFQDLNEARGNLRNRRTDAFFNKFDPFYLDPTMKAMFGARQQGIDWNEVMSNKQAVLFDFRHVQDIERRRFMMMWVFQYFLNFIKQRGAGRHDPISLFIDELTAFFSVQSFEAGQFAADVDELINVIARNYSLWLCIASQELYQFSDQLQKTLLTMGTQIHGVTSDPYAAEAMAHQFYRYDPDSIRKVEPVYFGMGNYHIPTIIDYKSVEFTAEEQRVLQGYQFRDLKRFCFLVRPAMTEGDLTGPMVEISIENLDRNQYPNEALTAKARAQLMKRDGRVVQDLLDNIDHRLSSDIPGFNLSEPLDVGNRVE